MAIIFPVLIWLWKPDIKKAKVQAKKNGEYLGSQKEQVK